MEEAARQFARRILAIHVAVLLLVVSLVYAASREVYQSTRQQATEQAKNRQALLAAQTARGIESFYQSIFDDLDLLRQADSEYDDEAADKPDPAPPPPTTRKGPGAGPPGPRFNAKLSWKDILPFDPTNLTGNSTFRSLFASLLWRQLQGRVALLFSVDRRGLERMERVRPEERAAAMDRFGVVTPLSPPNSSHIHARQIVRASQDWLMGVERPTISSYEQFDAAGGQKVGVNLICVPMTQRNPRVLVAAVDVREPRSKFIDTVNNDSDSTIAVLIDDAGTIMATATREQVGQRVMDILEDQFKPLARQYLGTGRRGIEIIDRPHVMAGHKYPPGLFTIEPVNIAGKKWTLMMVSPLAEVDAVVSRIFQRALFWAIFVICSMTAILVSTSIQLIRSRARMERLRNDVLTRELTQAREIQLAWLPQQKIAVPSIDIAAINQPASHISGDFYNWFELPDGRTVVTIGDVTGHGMGAAFLMATTQLLVHSTMLRLRDPGKTLEEVNEQLTRQVFSGQFVTMLVCVLDVDEGSLEVATAGHQAPILGQGGRFDPLPIEYNLVLGVEKDVTYKTERYDLPATASLVLFTDGVTDAKAVDGQRFELSRLIQTVQAGRAESAQQLIDSIVGRINQFRQTRELPDDLTLVCIQTLARGAFQAAEALSV
jgi:serine phosphatase RsbU (regulator of sigma subunit)